VPRVVAAGGSHWPWAGTPAPWSWPGGAPAGIPTGLATELSATGVRVNCVRVDEALRTEALRTEALRTEALATLIGDPEPGSRGVTPAELGAAVRWIVRQPASFTGHVLTFQRLRELGALPVHDTGGVR
jgi:NAD(P)-dependent dehydrogenase (short-subunit alcohol dehydrogenase family)